VTSSCVILIHISQWYWDFDQLCEQQLHFIVDVVTTSSRLLQHDALISTHNILFLKFGIFVANLTKCSVLFVRVNLHTSQKASSETELRDKFAFGQFRLWKKCLLPSSIQNEPILNNSN
jgi:hypothetical protein